jgi:TolB-like protein
VIESSKAVFLSYASQDAQAAQNLCNALRAAGIEVWFDQSELRGGDTWDAAIRRQIKSCALFIPMISKNTHIRGEGYFRLEWKLAVDRSHLMASDLSFLLPVVVDETPDQEDRVPDRFREVQWTRLPGGANADAFVDNVRRLLSSDAATPAVTSVGSSQLPPSSTSVARSTPSASRSFVPWIVGGVLILAIGYIVADKFLASKHGVPAAEAPATVPVQAGSVTDKSIAVLPFADMSEKHDQEYFSDGLAEELLDLLAKTPGLRVIARTSSFYFKGKQASLTEIAKTLNVANILEGSVRKSGNRLRVTTQLIRADTGEHLWSDTYDRDLKDIFQMQDDIAGAVVKELKATLLVKNGPGDRTDNMDAYARFLQGRSLSNQGSASDLRKATQVLQRAVELDPNYAAAWAALSDAFYTLSAYKDPDPDVDRDMESARAAVQKALSLNPDNAPAHYSRAIMRIVYEHDPKGAMADIDAAQRSDPNVTKPFDLVIVTGCHSGPCFQKYIREVSRDLELDPLNVNTMLTRAWAYGFADNPTASIADLRRVLELNPGIDNANYMLACALIAEHRFPEALAAAQAETNPLNRRTALALAYLALGRRAEADAMIKELLANDSKNGPLQIAEVYSFAGNKTAALDWMERDYEYRRSGVLYLGADPFLRPLSSEPRYIALLKRIGMSNQLPPAD